MRVLAGWLALFGVPLLCAVTAVSVMSAMLRSHDQGVLEATAQARARLTLASVAERLGRFTAWDPIFTSITSSTPPMPATGKAGAVHAVERQDMPVTDPSAMDADNATFSRVPAVLARAYEDETSLHWIALVDLQGVIRAGSDTTGTGGILPAPVRDAMHGGTGGDAGTMECILTSGRASVGQVPCGAAHDDVYRRSPEAWAISPWSIVHAGERLIGEPVRDALGRGVAFAVIGVDTAESGLWHEAASLRDTDGAAFIRHWRWVIRYLLAAGLLSLVVSAGAWWRARRQQVMTDGWRAAWSRAYRRQHALAHAMVELPGVTDDPL